MGNVASIANMLRRIGGYGTVITSEPAILKKAHKIILPGVGSFDYGMSSLYSLGITDVLLEKVTVDKTQLLAICLGMQLLTERSEEGELPGLGLIKGSVKKFATEWEGKKRIVPHMGWNYVYPKKETSLFMNSPEEMRFYFVHSYYVECKDHNDIVATTVYGQEFASAIGRNNIYGVQFHPEKSHKFGMNLLKNFMES